MVYINNPSYWPRFSWAKLSEVYLKRTITNTEIETPKDSLMHWKPTGNDYCLTNYKCWEIRHYRITDNQVRNIVGTQFHTRKQQARNLHNLTVYARLIEIFNRPTFMLKTEPKNEKHNQRFRRDIFFISTISCLNVVMVCTILFKCAPYPSCFQR